MKIDYEKVLNIDTKKAESRMDNNKYYNLYEPTSYEALEALIKNYEIKKEDHIVDFGSGKGRLAFFMNYFYDCGVTGVEAVLEFHDKAKKNLQRYEIKYKKRYKKIFLVNQTAENYSISGFENKFFFFNPFSANIFMTVVSNIIKSFEIDERVVDIILYYPTDEYIRFLEEKTFFNHVMDIATENTKNNPRDRFSIYRLGEGFIGLSKEGYLVGDCICSIGNKFFRCKK